jgi:hypothetical protein
VGILCCVDFPAAAALFRKALAGDLEKVVGRALRHFRPNPPQLRAIL